MGIEKGMSSKIHMYPSGLLVDPLDLHPNDIRIEDIAQHLGNQCRFSGGVREFYSVAQHAVMASHLVEAEFAWDALHHDDAEAYLQDMAKPLKNHERFGQPYRGAEARIEKVIGEFFDVTFPIGPEVKDADILMLVTEARDLKHGTEGWSYYQDIEPLDAVISPWSPRRSRREFMVRFKQLS